MRVAAVRRVSRKRGVQAGRRPEGRARDARRWSSATASGGSARSRPTDCSTGSSRRRRHSASRPGSARDCGHIGRLGEYAETRRGAGVNPDRHGQQLRRRPAGGTTGGRRAAARHQPALRRGSDRGGPRRPRLRHERRRRGQGPRLPHQQEARARRLAPRLPGQPTHDPSVLYKQPLGSILPMGGRAGLQGVRARDWCSTCSPAGLTGGRSATPAPLPPRGTTSSSSPSTPSSSRARDALIRESTALVEYVRETPGRRASIAITLPGDPERDMDDRPESPSGRPLERGDSRAEASVDSRLAHLGRSRV